MRNPRRVLSKAQILDRVWNYDFGGQANVVELYISYLRKKVDAGRAPMIHTMRGAGYVLKPAAHGELAGGPAPQRAAGAPVRRGRLARAADPAGHDRRATPSSPGADAEDRAPRSGRAGSRCRRSRDG
jgi:two-component system OmpR family response regulator